MQIRNANYLVPVSANPVKEADVDFQMVDVTVILRQMEGSGTKLNRSYRVLTETIRTSCDEVRASCQISGMLEFSLSNPANGKKSSGTSSFEYSLRFAPDGPKIFSEKGKIVSAQK